MTEIEQAVREVTELISLPEVYLKVQRLMDDPTSDIYDFAEVISVDPNLSARVLKVVNSAYFGFPDPIQSIPRAVNMIGIGQLHNMVLGVSAISRLALPNDILPLPVFWRTSLFVGVLARLLAEQLGMRRRSEQLFIAGLLHDIGHLVLYAKLPQQAIEARRIAGERGEPIHVAEAQVLGCHYGDIGALLMVHWKLPETLPLLTRHQPAPSGAGELELEATLVHLARACAQSEAQESPQAAANEADTEILARTGLSTQQLESSLDEARSISADMERIILP